VPDNIFPQIKKIVFLAEDYGINWIFSQNNVCFWRKIMQLTEFFRRILQGGLTCDFLVDVEGWCLPP
jgi:hypothetical protein